MIEYKNYFSFAEAVKLSGISEKKLRMMIFREQINPYRFGGQVYFDLPLLMELRAIVKLDLKPLQIKKIREYFDDHKMTKYLFDKRLVVCDKKVYLVESLDDITELLNGQSGQKILGQILLPELWDELQTIAKGANIKYISNKFRFSVA